MKKKIFLILLFLVIIINNVSYSGSTSTHSERGFYITCITDVNGDGKADKDYCDWIDFVITVSRLIGAIVRLAYWITVLISTAGAFLIMIEGPSPGWYQRGKTMITASIGAYILILLSAAIFDFILDFFKPELYNP